MIIVSISYIFQYIFCFSKSLEKKDVRSHFRACCRGVVVVWAEMLTPTTFQLGAATHRVKFDSVSLPSSKKLYIRITQSAIFHSNSCSIYVFLFEFSLIDFLRFHACKNLNVIADETESECTYLLSLLFVLHQTVQMTQAPTTTTTPAPTTAAPFCVQSADTGTEAQ